MFGPERVKTLDRLHAKLWLTNKGAVVGSSNASANGLGQEGLETSGLVEINLLVRDPAVLRELRSWFDNNVDRYSRAISPEDLTRARRDHRTRRKYRPTYRSETLLQAVRRSPDALADRDVRIWIWRHTERATWADELLEEVKAERRNPRIDCWQDVEGRLPPPGAFVLDFDASERGMRFDGAWRILSEDPVVNCGRGNLLLCVRAARIHHWPIGSRRAWEQAATLVLGSKTECDFEIDEFARRLYAAETVGT
jgi:hypothetical protein